MTEVFSENNLRHTDGLLALAETATPHDDVLTIIVARMTAAMRRAKKTHMTISQARSALSLASRGFLARHYYVLDDEKKTIDELSKRYLKGYQKWYRRVESEEKKIRREIAATGRSVVPLAEALRIVSPELYGEV